MSQAESRTVYAAGLVQGVVLVTFPAASTIFTSASQYGLSGRLLIAFTSWATASRRSAWARCGTPGSACPGRYGISAVVAVLLGGLSFGVAHGRPSPRSLHPRPQPARQAPAAATPALRTWSRPPVRPWP
jgi:hypothetical protein